VTEITDHYDCKQLGEILISLRPMNLPTADSPSPNHAELLAGLLTVRGTSPRAAGKVGASVNILGTNLSGATSVTFNGTAATFTFVSPSLITTTVPAGATTGEVKVIKPHGTVQSNVSFRVLH
jgi:uncharacterized protein (TIGR03437 family)